MGCLVVGVEGRLVGPALEEIVEARLLGLVPLVAQAALFVLRGLVLELPQEILGLGFHAGLHLQGDDQINHAAAY